MPAKRKKTEKNSSEKKTKKKKTSSKGKSVKVKKEKTTNSKSTKKTSTTKKNITSFDSYELIIAEKPKAASRVAFALADKGTLKKKSWEGIPYYELKFEGKPIVVASAVGHLFTLMEKGGNKWSYPVFDVEWVSTSKAQKNASYVNKYIKLLKLLNSRASEVTIATDYDIEGEVIGLNVVRFALKREDANRMKFSTLTPEELRKSYKNKSKTLDWSQARAGETRHLLDYYYGVNVSRALTSSIKRAGAFKVLSSGRVQGPALKIIVDREEEIKNFKPEKYWQVFLKAKTKNNEIVEAQHKKGNFKDKKKAELSKSNAEKGKPVVKEYSVTESKVYSVVPFDLTSLQMEAYRNFHITPKRTLEIAQNLYIEGLTSYPRTSSQKLPFSLGFKKILTKLSEQDKYSALAKKLLSKKKLIPHEGKKTDSAHPAIYPTGMKPKNLDEQHMKVYDLIVKRFMSVFGEPAVKENVKATIDSNGELFIASGSRLKEEGWTEYYRPYYKFTDKIIAKMDEGELLNLISVSIVEKETKPKPRYTQASLVADLTKKNLGTKATRAQIVDTLFKRKYVRGEKIEATELGIQAIKTLLKYSPLLLDEKLTRHFEEELEKIREGKKKPEDVIKEAKKVVSKILDQFKNNELSIGKELREANKNTSKEKIVGKCPVCGVGNLVVRHSKKTGKQFIACDQYPKCKTTFSLPQNALILPTNEKCQYCGWPLVLVIRKGKRPWKMCFNPNCPGKNKGKEKKESKQNNKE